MNNKEISNTSISTSKEVNKISRARRGRADSLNRKSSSNNYSHRRSNSRHQSKSRLNYRELGIDECCLRCGKFNHRSQQCRIDRNQLKCSACQRKGHVEKICIKTLLQKKNRSQQTASNSKPTNQIEDSQDDINYLNINNVINIFGEERIEKNDSNKYFVNVLIEGKTQKFEVDSGAGLTLLPESAFKKLKLKAEMQRTTIQFRSYTSEIFAPLRYIQTQVEYKRKRSNETAYIVPDRFSPILGRDWIRHLNIELKEIDGITANVTNQINSIDSPGMIKRIEERYKKIFTPEVGAIPKFTCSLKLRPNWKPVFIKAREIPYALKEKVEQELIDLEAGGIITKIESSDWGPPLVVIPKPDGKLRLCVDYKKVEAITEINRPANPEEVKRFLGMAMHYARFIPNASTITHPLRCLLRENTTFKWTAACEAAFIKLKQEIASNRVLMPFNPELPLTVACDASPTGIAAVLSHTVNGIERPIAFASRSLTSAEQNYSQLDREALAIVFGVDKFFMYTYGKKFDLITDNRPLSRIFKHDANLPPMTAARLLRYATFLQSFNYVIKHRKAEEHIHMDCLSRAPLATTSGMIESTFNQEVGKLRDQSINQISTIILNHQTLVTETRKDVELSKLKNDLQTGKVVDPKITIEDGIIFKRNRIVIPKSLQPIVLEELHHTHIGVVKMK
ncbi:PREDICTED: uncharacterized protein LOC105451673 [Wasmannia auropunctata]|uniref:uncharacterized protein LOC105451673 n=1 Tax=Wasmannia auropunctata TaxID=64793 RepID=UPI0005EDE7A2|nr:PREDICTED: uncharacterized protein LOC105451673 [Wasmannia auropunctata]